MHTVSQLLGEKGNEVFSISSDEPVFAAVKLMADKGIGALLVIDDGELAGIISERDYARKVILRDRSSKTTPIAQIMTAKVVTVSSHISVDECMGIMTQGRFRHLPVVDDGQVVGMLSLGDLVRVKLEDQAREIESLQQYIAG